MGGLVIVAALSGATGWVVGHRSSTPRWQIGSVHVSVEGKEATFFAGQSPATGFFDSVAWIDASGAVHDSGWPSCLTDHTTIARFMATDQLPDPLGQHVLVAVDCRQTH